jgi:RNA polymerase sigma factor (sigma-70 family)
MMVGSRNQGRFMSRNQLESVLSYLHRMVDRHAEAPDALVLRRFVNERDEAAFEALVRRHGPLVLATCRRLLADANDVDDAFQATFFVLARRAGAIAHPEQLAGWLHGVAVRVAGKARVARARRLAHEQALADVPAEATMDDTMRRELWSVLDEEVNRLPSRYQAPFVLCYLAGRTNEEAARELGHPTGTIFSRLARARELIRARLTRRGMTLSSAALTAALATQPVDAALPSSLLEATVRGGPLVAAGQTAALGSQTAKAMALTEETLRTMFIAKAKVAAVWVLVLMAAGTGVAMVGQRGVSQKQQTEVARADAADDEALKRENEKLKKELNELRHKVEAMQRKLATLEKEAAPVTFMGKPKGYWRQQLRDVDPKTRHDAIGALGFIASEDSSVIPWIADMLKSKSYETREVAISTLANLGPDAKVALPQLLQLVGASDWLQPALTRIDPEGKTAIPALIEKLNSEDAKIRAGAARWLADYGAQPSVVPALLAATHDKDAEVRCEAVLSLGQIGRPANAAVVPRLIALLKDTHAVTERWAPDGIVDERHPRIGPMGPGPSFKTKIATVGDAAANALYRIDPEAAKKAEKSKPKQKGPSEEPDPPPPPE